MARRRTHKIAVRTTGLSPEDAARLHYLICCATSAFTREYETASNVPLSILRGRTFPEDLWHLASRQDRIDLVD
jgi:hypothetical protein